MPKIHQNALSQDPYPQWGLLVRGRRKGRGPTPKAKRGVISPLPQSRLVEINTVKLEIPSMPSWKYPHLGLYGSF